jgi:hypothetical protein
LAALPVFVGASQTGHDAIAPRNQTAHTWQMTERPTAAHWAYAFGMEGEEALAFAVVSAIECSFFGPVGGIACGVTGAL